MSADDSRPREAAAVLADWREIERAMRNLQPSSANDCSRVVAELADLHAEARRLRVEYTEIIRGPATRPRNG